VRGTHPPPHISFNGLAVTKHWSCLKPLGVVNTGVTSFLKPGVSEGGDGMNAPSKGQMELETTSETGQAALTAGHAGRRTPVIIIDEALLPITYWANLLLPLFFQQPTKANHKSTANQALA